MRGKEDAHYSVTIIFYFFTLILLWPLLLPHLNPEDSSLQFAAEKRTFKCTLTAQLRLNVRTHQLISTEVYLSTAAATQQKPQTLLENINPGTSSSMAYQLLEINCWQSSCTPHEQTLALFWFFFLQKYIKFLSEFLILPSITLCSSSIVGFTILKREKKRKGAILRSSRTLLYCSGTPYQSPTSCIGKGFLIFFISVMSLSV